jgi:FKBP-type peptidyl-prolyl cis-trans isomerase (trigger factor)
MEEIMKQENITVTPDELNVEFDKLPEAQRNSQQMSYLANKTHRGQAVWTS